MTLRNQARLAAINLIALLVATIFTVTPIHAGTPSWAVSIDADSTGPTDADVQSSHNIFGLTKITVGAVVNASAAQPINNIRGWAVRDHIRQHQPYPWTGPIRGANGQWEPQLGLTDWHDRLRNS